MKPQTILIVDDEAAICRLITRAFCGAEIEVLVTDSVASAEGLLRDRDVDLVLCDQNLPGEKGLSFLNRLEKQNPTVRRVLITGDPDPALADQAIDEARVHRCLFKPFDVASLRITIRELLMDSSARLAIAR